MYINIDIDIDNAGWSKARSENNGMWRRKGRSIVYGILETMDNGASTLKFSKFFFQGKKEFQGK